MERLEEGLALMQGANDGSRLADYLMSMAEALSHAGQFSRALELSNEATALNTELFARSKSVVRRNEQLSAGLESVSLLLHLGKYGTADGAILALGDNVPQLVHFYYRTWTSLLRGWDCLGQGDMVEAQNWFSRAEPFAFNTWMEAWVRAGQTLAAVAEGQHEQARVYLSIWFESALAEEDDDGLVQAMFPATAVWKASQGSVEQAVELWARATQYPMVRHSQLFADLNGRPVEEAAQQLRPEVWAAAEARGRELDPHETARALLAELKAAAVTENGE